MAKSSFAAVPWLCVTPFRRLCSWQRQDVHRRVDRTGTVTECQTELGLFADWAGRYSLSQKRAGPPRRLVDALAARLA